MYNIFFKYFKINIFIIVLRSIYIFCKNSMILTLDYLHISSCIFLILLFIFLNRNAAVDALRQYTARDQVLKKYIN